MTIVHTLAEAPFYGELTGRDGLACRVWKNPTKSEFGNAIKQGATPELAGLRGLIASGDLYVWQSVNLLHTDFERETGIEGMRIALRAGELQVNDETVDQPDQFPWLFPDAKQASELDIDERRQAVETWLLANQRLKVIYSSGFKVVWYA